MKIANLKNLLEEFDDNDEIVVSVIVGNSETPVITYDVSFAVSEHGGLVLEARINDSDFK